MQQAVGTMTGHQAPGRPRRRENRRHRLLDAAAAVFRQSGFDGASVRDIAAAAGMRPSAVYYFFCSKEDLLEAVYAEGVQRISTAVEQAVAGRRAPWRRLEAAAAAHLSTLLDPGDYAAVVAGVLPKEGDEFGRRLIVHRDRYEAQFARLMAALPLAPKTNRGYLRLALLGALNAVPTWYRPGGDAPEKIAAQIVALFREPLDPER